MATNKVTTNVIDMSGNTGGLVWSQGTTAQRPAGVAGDLRLNTDDSRLEFYNGTDWKRLSESAAVSTFCNSRLFSRSRWWWRRCWMEEVLEVSVHLMVLLQEEGQQQNLRLSLTLATNYTCSSWSWWGRWLDLTQAHNQVQMEEIQFLLQ